jgi:hypothetical protein
MSEPQRACIMQTREGTNTEASILNTPLAVPLRTLSTSNATPTRMSRSVPPATVTVGAANCMPIRVAGKALKRELRGPYRKGLAKAVN